MALDDETAERIAQEAFDNRESHSTWAWLRDAARRGYAARDAEVEELRAWKSQALEVLSGWERVWEAAGMPGQLGEQKSENVQRWIEELRADLDAAAYRAGQYQARIARAEATLAKLRAWATAVTWPTTPADDEQQGQVNAAGDVLAILDESPTEAHSSSLTVTSSEVTVSDAAGETPAKPEGWARCNVNAFHSKSAAYAAGYMNGWDARGGGSR